MYLTLVGSSIVDLGKSFTSSHGLLAVDLDGDVLESGFELLMLIVCVLLGVDTELKVETVDCAVSIIFEVLPIYIDMNVAQRAVVDDLERDPYALHAADKDMATSVVSERTILVVQHSRSSV